MMRTHAIQPIPLGPKEPKEPSESQQRGRTDEPPVAWSEDPDLRPLTDEEETDNWEVVHDGRDTAISFRYSVGLAPEETQLIAHADAIQELEYVAIAKRAILDAARAVIERERQDVARRATA